MNILFIIIGVLFFNLIIIAHEWGHYFTAKSFGVKVNEFALGMGPKIFSIKKGETTFSLRAFPLGGFCAMEGEDEKSDDPRAFETKKAWQKIIVVSMGAIMNLVVGFLITFALLIQNDSFASTTVSRFSDNSISQNYGLEIGDRITKVDGSQIFTYKDLVFILSTSGKTNFDIGVNREGKNINLENVEFKSNDTQNGRKTAVIDFYVEPIKKTFGTLLSQVFLDTISTVKIVWSSLIGLITGKFALSAMSGPIGIASAIGEATSEGLKTSLIAGLNSLLSLIAMITINLGVINLLPLPALDGGRLVFLFFELITGKKVDPKYEGLINAVGFILFILLTIFISYHDIMRLFSKA